VRARPAPPATSARARGRLVVALAALAVAVGGPWLLLSVATLTDRYDVRDAQLPSAPTAIVFGAGLTSDGGPSPFLVQRLDVAVTLYSSHRVQHLLMTGDNSVVSHDEVGVMHRYAVAHGVPDDVVTEDHAGFNTYDSCYRAHAIFGVTKAIVVTQDYHLPRAVFTCQRLGIDAVGVGSSQWHHHTGDMVAFQARELLSDAKALWQLLTRPRPHFLGPHETLR
jgi:vancomycin permeability regulator SanA